MRVGLALPHYDFSLPGGGPITFERTAAWATRAEGLGFESLWVSDHLVYSLSRYGLGEQLFGSLEPLTLLAGLATSTTRARLGTLVLGAALRPAAVLAKSAAAIDLFSGGRLELGLGAGWYEDEFVRFGYGFGSVGERFSLLEETVEALDGLLRGGPVTFDGDHVRLSEAFNHPAPIQRPRPPIWVGAKGGDRALRLAARHADGWNTVWRWSIAGYGERVRRAREICEEEGRDPATLGLSLGLYTVVGEDRADLEARWERMGAWMPGAAVEPLDGFARDTLTGTVPQVLDRLSAFAELGVAEIIMSPAPLPFAIPDTGMVELISEAVLPEAREL